MHTDDLFTDRLSEYLDGELDATDRAAVDRATRRIVSKLLHDPIEKTRRLSASKQGHIYAAALRELFGLDDEPAP